MINVFAVGISQAAAMTNLQQSIKNIRYVNVKAELKNKLMYVNRFILIIFTNNPNLNN